MSEPQEPLVSDLQSALVPAHSTSPSSSQVLQYPQILLEPSFDSLLTHSFPTPSTPATRMETSSPRQTRSPPTAPSLSESWASISDAEYSHDEDLQSETTDAGSLIDIHSANDVQSIQEDTPSEDGSDDEEHHTHDQLAQPQVLTDLPPSTHSRTPAASHFFNPDPHSEEITLDEPDTLQDTEHVLVKHILTPFSESEASRLQLPISSRDGYVGTLHMTISKRPLHQTTRNSFRLLLLGPDYTESLRASLVNKVADALVASNDGNEQHTPTSRYHIVPDSFGPGSQPAAAEVIPVDRTMDVDSFHSAILGGLNNKDIILCNEQTIRRTVSTFNDGQAKYVVTTPGWQQPDLAIVLTDSNDSPDTRLSACTMMIFAKRLKIPVIVVRMDNDWNADFAPLIFAETGAQLCIEKWPLSQDSVLRSLPLDIATFLNISPAQLGRHIAHLVQKPHSALDLVTMVNSGQNLLFLEPGHAVVEVKQRVNDFIRRIARDGPQRTMRMIAIVAATVILLQMLSQWTMMLTTSFKGRVPPLPPSVTETINASVGVHTHVPSVAVVQSSSTVSVPLTIGSQVATGNFFEAETLGTSHIIVRTLDKKGMKQKFSIELCRNGRWLESETKMLFPGVASIHLDPDQAFGAINVCFTSPKALSGKCVEVQLGEQSFMAWVKELIIDGGDRLQEQLAVLHASLEEMKKSERAQETMKEAHKRLMDLERAAEQDFKLRWATMSTWQSEARQKANGLLDNFCNHISTWYSGLQDKLSRHVSGSYEKACAGAHGMYQESLKSVEQLQARVGNRIETARLEREARQQAQLERLATSQERAQHMVKKLRERMGY